MKIAILNTIKPSAGSGDGMTEYAYQLQVRLQKENQVTPIYPLTLSKRNDMFGLFYTNSLFKLRLRELAKEDFDIIHIANQELGFAAKILKRLGTKARVITSIHDLMRVKDIGYNRGLVQDAYSRLVASSVMDAVKFSDFIIFSASTVSQDAQSHYKGFLKRHATTLLCPKEEFRTKPLPKKGPGQFKVGYIGALAFRKNVIMVLKSAKKLYGTDPSIKFLVYGSGAEKENLISYKHDNSLENVSFMGFAPEDKLMQIYDSFDVFYYPSLEEGSSLPILDAQARGLPAIVYSKNHMDKEVTRYCLKAQDEEHAARLILKLKNAGYSKAQRERSTKYARSFSWDRVAKETFELYKKARQQRLSH